MVVSWVAAIVNPFIPPQNLKGCLEFIPTPPPVGGQDIYITNPNKGGGVGVCVVRVGRSGR